MIIKNATPNDLKEEKKKYIKEQGRNPIVLVNKKTLVELSKESNDYVDGLETWLNHGASFYYNLCYLVIDETLEDGELEIR